VYKAREQGTGIVAAARSDESIGAESTATAFPVSSAAVLRIPLHQRTLSCNERSIKQPSSSQCMHCHALVTTHHILPAFALLLR
jgi:hypothetical protein